MRCIPSPRIFGVTWLASLSLFACGGDDSKAADSGVASELTCPIVVSEAACDKTLRPIVFIHGTMGAGDNAEHVAQLFGSNGYCQDRFVAIDYNSLNLLALGGFGGGASPAPSDAGVPINDCDPNAAAGAANSCAASDDGTPFELIDALITKVLAETGQTKVDLIGHSQGGMWGYKYASNPNRAARIANYIHLSGGNQPAPPTGVRTMSISSKVDVTGTTQITGADTILIEETADHMAVAESTESFKAMYTFLIGREPQYTDVQCGDEMVTLGSKALTFGDNTPAFGTIEFYELDKDPYKRGTPVITATVGADGTVPPATVRRGVAYESLLRDTAGKVVGHQYFTPWKRNDYLVRALVPSSQGLTTLITNMLPKDDAQVVFIARWNQGGLRADLGQTLTIDGVNVLPVAVANAMSTTVALFMYDDNHNGVSDVTPITSYGAIPFVKGVDAFLPTAKAAYMNVTLTSSTGTQTLKVPNWPSATNGPTLVMFQ